MQAEAMMSDARGRARPVAEPNMSDARFIVRECGSIAAAVRYCERLACSNGPLSWWYAEAAKLVQLVRAL